MLDRLHSTEDIAFMVRKVAGRQAMLHDFHYHTLGQLSGHLDTFYIFRAHRG